MSAYAESLVRRDWRPIPMDEASFRDWLRTALDLLPVDVIAAEFRGAAVKRAYNGDPGWVWGMLAAIAAKMAGTEEQYGA